MLQKQSKVIVLFALVGVFNLFFFHRFGNLGFILWSFSVFLFLSFVLKVGRKQFFFWGSMLLLLSFCLIFRAGGFVILILTFSSLLLLMLYTYILSCRLFFFRSLQELFISPFQIIFKYLNGSIEGFISLIANRESKSKKVINFVVIARGIFIALPIILVLIILLSSGDPVYGKFIQNILNIQIDFKQEIWQRIFLSLFFFVLFLPFIFYKIKKENPPVIKILERFAIASEMTIVIFLVSLTLGSFLIIQFPYVFVNVAKEINLAQFGVKTYSEYVRRGFFEMIFASLIVYGTVWLGLVFLRQGKNKNTKTLKYLQIFVIGELFIFIFSLFRRISLYVEYHGWSLVRIYGGIFLLWMVAMTVTLFWRHFSKKYWVLKESIISFIFILFIGLFNAENFIVTSSRPPTVNGRVDYIYLSRMSSDGYLGWKKAYTFARDVLIDKNLQYKNLINKDERRDVMYSGKIVYELSKNYHDLIMSYGNHNEIQKYLLELFSKTDFSKAPYQDGSNIPNLIANLQGNKTNLQIHFQMPNFYFSPENIAPQWPMYFFYKRDNGIKYPGIRDKIFIWNYSSASVFTQIRNDIKIDNLLLLQKKYHDLFVKISHQSPSERDFEFDISLDSPLLD